MKKNKQKEIKAYVEELIESDVDIIKKLENEETKGETYSELKRIFYDSLSKEQKLIYGYLRLAYMNNMSSYNSSQQKNKIELDNIE